MRRSLAVKLVAVGLAAAGLITMGLLSRIQILPTDSDPPEKQTVWANVEATDVAGRLTQSAYMQLGTTEPEQAGVDPGASCPGRADIRTGIRPWLHPPIYENRITNVAVVKASTGSYYYVFAGGPRRQYGPTLAVGEAEAGVLLVAPIERDPCAAIAAGRASQTFKTYRTPRGPLTILKIDGDVVIYGIEGGGTGRFDYVKGEFLP